MEGACGACSLSDGEGGRQVSGHSHLAGEGGGAVRFDAAPVPARATGAIMIPIQEVERYAREVLDRDEHEVVYG